MSLIQDALEKIGKSPRQSNLLKPVKPIPHLKPEKTKFVQPTAVQVKKVFQPMPSEMPHSQGPVSSIVWSLVAGVFVFILSFIVVSKLKYPVIQMLRSRDVSIHSVMIPMGISTSMLSDAPQSVSDLIVNGIGKNGTDRFAIINNEILGIGDSFNGILITDIQDKHVSVKRGSRDLVLKIN